MELQMALLLSVMAITLIFWRIDDGWTNRKIFIFIVTVILTCFSGFRSWWIGDCIKYYTQYTQINNEGLINSLTNNYVNAGFLMGIFGHDTGKQGNAQKIKFMGHPVHKDRI